ncbi:MAG TPA: hypothetical protein VMB21_03020 [Candidatus Limnocylindria bacterium]|jgi:hypothetical protein|nr:hypothetical protein [Candidatus Limnocylindria bacterium]
MSDDPLQYQRALDHAGLAERGDQLLTGVGNVVEYTVPPLTWELGGGLLLAIAAILILRNRRGYLPDWARSLLGVKRTLHSRSELRPKPSPLQPPAWR